MPQSNSQTSPRLGGTFLLLDHRGESIAGVGRYVVAERAGIPRREVEHDLSDKGLFFLSPKSFEFGKQFCCGRTHVWNVTPAVELSGAELRAGSDALYSKIHNPDSIDCMGTPKPTAKLWSRPEDWSGREF